MSWICEICGREFKNKNQFHSCEQSTIEQHLEGKPDLIVEIFHKLLDIISDLGEFELLPLKTVIQAQKSSTFLSIYLKRNKVHLEFQASGEKKHSSITKRIKISNNRYFHFADFKNQKEIDDEVVSIIKEAYNLSPTRNLN